MPQRFHKSQRRLLGAGRQRWIRRFFGGNALASLGALFLICAFLSAEAVLFFPQHHRDLVQYRQTGQEYVDHLIRETKAVQGLVSLSNQLYFRELDARFEVERGLIEVGESLIERAEDLQLAEQNELGWEEAVNQVLSEVPRAELDPYQRLDQESLQELTLAVKSWDPEIDDEPELIRGTKRFIAAEMVVFETIKNTYEKAALPLRSLRQELVSISSGIKGKIEQRDAAQRRVIALKKGLKKATSREEKDRLMAEIASVPQFAPISYKKETEALRVSFSQHEKVVVAAQKELSFALSLLPDIKVEAEGDELVQHLRAQTPVVQEKLTKELSDSQKWQWDRPVAWWSSVTHFFFGTEWVTNSTWRDSFGVLPLLTGTILVSGIALLVAVPLSIAAAVYVNQIARPLEKTLVKPVIELIQAIPSVVLGFFGIMVLGEAIRELSQTSWLDWVPGFPMQERLNALNAGLLLALMACPTIFTLCEDALEAVPRGLVEGSLALGASRLQTVARVVLPTASSGVLAAVLLGFGRIIGETMVVLLVAGNKIALPDWSAGVGIMAEPTHTLTGIIAQEMGEVTRGTLHFRALFLVGFVLFAASLLINGAAQLVIRRLGRQ